MAFTPVDKGPATVRIKIIFFNQIPNLRPCPTKEKDDVTRDAFYERLERTHEHSFCHNMKIVFGDLNTRVVLPPRRNILIWVEAKRHHRCTKYGCLWY